MAGLRDKMWPAPCGAARRGQRAATHPIRERILLFNSGLRIGEATQLRWKDFERYNDRDGVDRWRVWFVGKARSGLVPQKVPDKRL
jgi:integrase